ncbi:hypothetical protein AB3S75_031388 [Citrus x aurantiifolia]
MPEKVQQWRFALKEASNDPVKIRPEGKLADGIVNDILMKLEKKFGVQKENVTTSATESKLAVEENPVPSPKHLAEDEMTLPPSRHTLAMHKSEIQLATLDTEESAADVSRKMATNVAARENPVPNPKHLAEDEMTHSPSRHTQAMHKSEIQPGTLGTEGSAAYVSGKTATNVAAEENPVPTPKHLAEDEMIHPTSRHTLAMHISEIQPATLDTGGSAAHVSENIAINLAGEDNPIPSPKYLTEDEVTHLPSRDTLAMYESEIQLAPLDTVGSAAHMSADGSPLHIHAEFGARSFQDKGKGQTIHRHVACGKQSVNPAVPVAGAESGTGNMIAVKSLKRNVQNIFRCVNDVRVSKIGVHGVGGIGKTTVLKALISYSKTKNMFPLIMLVTVSRYWNIRKIQIEVLRQFLSCRENHEADSLVAESVVHGSYESDSQVAEKLLQVLKGKNFFLLLDDVWEQIDLEAVGIPDPSSNNGCKILMASRKLDVCQNMNVSKVIELESLSGKEAWELFGKQVGRIIDLPDIRPFARAVVKGCHGLPLLIIVTGKALKGESNVSVWEHASKNFSLSSTTGAHHTSDVIQLLKFSFDCLKDHDIKSCFLYCALFPEDEGVNISDLVEYFIQEGLITTTWADAHERGHDIVYVLVHISLLQVTEGGDSIKMHGLIRDLALGILSSAVENNQFMLRAEGRQFLCKAYLRLTAQSNAESSSSAILLTSPESSRLFIPAAHQFLLGASAGLTELPIEEWKQAEMIFLMDNKLCTLPEKPSCPNLLTLFLQRNHQLREIPPSFFESMTSLKVLNLSNTRIKSLPNTIVSLQNLEILILRDCEHLVVLPSEVGSLVLLEVLDLRGTEINHLPDEIGELASLRYLEVFFYGSVNKSEYVKLPHNLISRGTILRLEALETLSIVVSSGDERWYKDAKSVMIEVSKLPKLSNLRFHFPEVELVDLFLKESVAWKGQMLTKFKFVVGHDVKSITSRVPDYVEFDYNQQSRCLRFVNCPSISPGVCQILARSTAFYVDHHIGIDNLSNFGIDNINALKYCIISECPGIKTLVDDIKEHGTPIFPSLESLNFYLLWNFTSIWNENLPGGSFAELRILSVHACPKLKYVFTSSMIRSLSKLEKLAVEDCEIIETIIAEDEMTDSGCIALSSLKMLRLNYLPRLENVGRIVCPSLEYISFYDCPQLKKIDLDSKLKALIEIKAEKNWWDALEWEDSEEYGELRKHLEHRLTIN